MGERHRGTQEITKQARERSVVFEKEKSQRSANEEEEGISGQG